jgi:magnesium-transporting ATPase (P-type)
MENKLKEQTIKTIQTLNSCNIRTIMATGDNMLTAISVGRECNIIEKEKTDATVNEITSAYFKKFNVHPEVYITNTSNGTYEII